MIKTFINEILSNFNYYRKYKNLKNKNKRYRRTINKLKRQLGRGNND